jgi:hypothetical protein
MFYSEKRGTRMRCSKCQFENPDGIKFCCECGADGWVEKYKKELEALS